MFTLNRANIFTIIVAAMCFVYINLSLQLPTTSRSVIVYRALCCSHLRLTTIKSYLTPKLDIVLGSLFQAKKNPEARRLGIGQALLPYQVSV